MSRYVVYELQKSGSRGPQVSAIQEALPRWACEEYLKVDGVYGERTVEAITSFQETSGLSPDGIVGPVTGQALGVWVSLAKGFDASNWNTILWDNMPFDVTFCNLKSTEGVGFEDPSFRSKVSNALALSMDVGAYHYTKFRNSPYWEAASFLEAVSEYPIRRLYLDLEYRLSDLNAEAIWKWAQAFLSTVAGGSRPGTRVGIYTSRNYMAEVGLQKYTAISEFDLWAADWSSQPYVYPWKTWDTWQYTSTGDVPWAEGNLDLNYRILET